MSGRDGQKPIAPAQPYRQHESNRGGAAPCTNGGAVAGSGLHLKSPTKTHPPLRPLPAGGPAQAQGHGGPHPGHRLKKSTIWYVCITCLHFGAFLFCKPKDPPLRLPRAKPCIQPLRAGQWYNKIIYCFYIIFFAMPLISRMHDHIPAPRRRPGGPGHTHAEISTKR